MLRSKNNSFAKVLTTLPSPTKKTLPVQTDNSGQLRFSFGRKLAFERFSRTWRRFNSNFSVRNASICLVWSGQLREQLPPEINSLLTNSRDKEIWNPTTREERWKNSAIKNLRNQDQNSLSYPRTNLMISPGWRISPTSSQTDTVIEPVLSATRHARTTWASFVLVAFPTRNGREFERGFRVRSNREWARG